MLEEPLTLMDLAISFGFGFAIGALIFGRIFSMRDRGE